MTRLIFKGLSIMYNGTVLIVNAINDTINSYMEDDYVIDYLE